MSTSAATTPDGDRAHYLNVDYGIKSWLLTIEHKTYTYWYKRPYLSTGPVVSGVQSEGVKRILGTVPVEEDGSARFTVPAMRNLYFQALDENHLAMKNGFISTPAWLGYYLGIGPNAAAFPVRPENTFPFSTKPPPINAPMKI